MKKVFTHLAVALLATNAVSVNAETVTANFQTWSSAKGYEDYYKPFSLEINQAEDGSYTMPNFMNSGSDVSFTFDAPAVGKYSQISITSPTENVATDWEWGKGYEDYYALIDENGESLVLSEENTKGVTKELTYPILVTADDGYLYAYIQGLDTSKSEYKYYADFTFVAYSDDDADENGNWYYMSFYFGKEEATEPADNITTAYFQTWTSAKGYEDYYKPFNLEINKVADGSYTMPNFMNSGSDVSFTFDVPAVGKYAQISITSPTENVATDWEWGKGYEDYYALIDENGDSLVLSEENTKGETKELTYPIIVTADDGYLYAYIQALDTSKSEYKYYADFTFVAYSDDDADENGNWYYMSFYFDKEDSSEPTEPTEPTEPIGEEGVTVYIDDYDGYAVADPFETTLVANSDGSYTLNNVMSSDQPLSFKFTDSIDDWADVEITSPLDTSVTYPYLMSADGKNYLFCTVYGFDGKEGATEFTYPYIYLDGCGVYCYDPTDADNTYKYYASLCLNAFNADATKSVGWFYLEFFFGENGTVKVNAVNADESAPVEYYNLNGMRVENPSNGIFIRKQGATAKKVVIK